MPQIEWNNQTAVCVIMAARGYPGTYEKGKVIEGLNSEFGPDVMVFHAGTARDSQGRIMTNGGRVLGVTALGEDARNAIDNAYSAVRKIRWGENGHYLQDRYCKKGYRSLSVMETIFASDCVQAFCHTCHVVDSQAAETSTQVQ